MAFGLWLNRHLIDVSKSNKQTPLPVSVEMLMACMYATFILVGDFGYLNPDRLPIDRLEFASSHTFEFISYWYVEVGIVLAAIPLIGIAGGRIWPYMMLLILIAVPICGKTLRSVGFNPDNLWQPGLAWFCLVQVPMVWGIVMTAWAVEKRHRHTTATFAGAALLFTSILYFSLNSVHWAAWPLGPDVPWNELNPNQVFNLVAMICLVVLAISMLFVSRRSVARTGKESDS